MLAEELLSSTSNTLEVCIEGVTDDYITAVINSKRRVNADSLTNIPDDLFQHDFTVSIQRFIGCIVREILIVLLDEFSSA